MLGDEERWDFSLSDTTPAQAAPPDAMAAPDNPDGTIAGGTALPRVFAHILSQTLAEASRVGRKSALCVV